MIPARLTSGISPDGGTTDGASRVLGGEGRKERTAGRAQPQQAVLAARVLAAVSETASADCEVRGYPAPTRAIRYIRRIASIGS